MCLFRCAIMSVLMLMAEEPTLTNLSQDGRELRERFNADKECVRMILILSPT